MGVRVKGWDKIRLRILQRDGWLCHYCGAEANEVDHVIPRVLGGGEDDENLVSACVPCNRSKGKRVAPKPRPNGFFRTPNGQIGRAHV